MYQVQSNKLHKYAESLTHANVKNNDKISTKNDMIYNVILNSIYNKKTKSKTNNISYIKNILSQYDDSKIFQMKVKEINLEKIRPQRAGVIMYTFFNNDVYIGLGVDTISGDLTDFGGGIQYRNDKNVINGALREFSEETLYIFKPLNIMDIMECPVAYDDNNLIIFIHIDLNPFIISSAFDTTYESLCIVNDFNKFNLLHKKVFPEVKAIKWLSSQQYYNSLSENGIFFTRVKNFLLKVGNINKFI